MARKRCGWAEGSDALMLAYHDQEWGTPSRDERHLFEMLTLEGAQAGLSWQTILNKREGYRRSFVGFDPAKIARFGEEKIERLMRDPGIVRNRAKIDATIGNARTVLAPIEGNRQRLSDIPAETAESRAMSKELKKRGFRFVGPTICYAFMQAVGMVNDHVASCFRWAELASSSRKRTS